MGTGEEVFAMYNDFTMVLLFVLTFLGFWGFLKFCEKA